LLLTLACGVFLVAGGASATLFDVTINDGEPTPGLYPSRENNEVEFGNVSGQEWDLEAMYFDDVSRVLTLVGGFNFKDGQKPTGWNDALQSGDIFLKLSDHSPLFGVDLLEYGGENQMYDTVSNFFGYNYVIAFDRSSEDNGEALTDSLSYSVYQLGEEATLVNPWFDSNNRAAPYRYESGGTLLSGSGSEATFGTGLPDFVDPDFQLNHEVGSGAYAANQWYYLTLSLDAIPFAVNLDTWVHFTMGCGNDNLMGRISQGGGGAHAPEPSTMLLLGFGLLGVARMRRERG
jgi:hypothetical protein